MNADKNHSLGTVNDGMGRLNKLAYRDGCIYGESLDRDVPEGNKLVNDRNRASRGLLFGITIAVLLGLISGILVLLMHQNRPSSSGEKNIPLLHNNQPPSLQENNQP